MRESFRLEFVLFRRLWCCLLDGVRIKCASDDCIKFNCDEYWPNSIQSNGLEVEVMYEIIALFSHTPPWWFDTRDCHSHNDFLWINNKNGTRSCSCVSCVLVAMRTSKIPTNKLCIHMRYGRHRWRSMVNTQKLHTRTHTKLLYHAYWFLSCLLSLSASPPLLSVSFCGPCSIRLWHVAIAHPVFAAQFSVDGWYVGRSTVCSHSCCCRCCGCCYCRCWLSMKMTTTSWLCQ